MSDQLNLLPDGGVVDRGEDDDARKKQELLLEAWLSQYPRGYRPPEREVRKQARVAGRLAGFLPMDDLLRAIRALPHTYPFNNGQPFDLFTIEGWLSRLLVVGTRLDAGWDPALAAAAKVRGFLDG